MKETAGDELEIRREMFEFYINRRLQELIAEKAIPIPLGKFKIVWENDK